MIPSEVVDWDAFIRDPRFQSLHRRKTLFLWGLMVISVVYYFLLPIGAAYYQDLFKIRLWGVVNVGLLFALSEFVVAWAIAAAGIEQVLDVVVETFGFVAHVVHQRPEFLFVRQRRRRAQHGGGAEDGGERRAQLVADRADQGLAQLVGLRAHTRLADGVRDAQPFQRRGGVGQHRIDPDAQLVRAFLGFAAEIDRDDAELGTLGRHRADQPDIAAFGGHRHAAVGVAAAGCNFDDLGEHCLRHRDAGAPSAAAGSIARTGEQDDFALHDGGEVVFDRGMNVGHVERHRQPARKGVEVAQVDLALVRHFQLAFEPGGELAHHHRDEDEQDEIDDFLRIRDAEAVERRKEEGGGEYPAHRGNDRRYDSPARGRDHHREQIDDGAVFEP